MLQTLIQYVELTGRLLCSGARKVVSVIPNVLTTLAVTGLLISSPGMAFAIDPNATPQGGNVVAGSASISSTANSVIVNQSSQRTVIDWQSFNIGEKASAEFKQPNASALAVNRVTGGGSDPTQILGTLKSNGQVMVLDSNGVFFGSKSRVDVGGLIASTGGIDVNQVMSGAAKIDIMGVNGGQVSNVGEITAREGGLVAFVAPHVANSGIITADLGRVELASGSAVTVDLYGDKLVELAVNGEVADALVENSGTIQANGGRVAMTARAAQGVVNNVINMSGIVRANTVSKEAGRIVLRGNDAGKVSVSGTIEAKGTTGKGGRVDITGVNVALNDAYIDVSGKRGGGEVYVGGGLYGALDGMSKQADVAFVSEGTVINADGTNKGNGGTVVIWSNQHTGFYGTVTARGGSKGGNGGLVEVSTGEAVIFEGRVDTTAAKGNVGSLLIDPASVFIGNGAQTLDGTYLNAQSLADNLVFTSIIVQADNDISIVDNIDLSSSIFGIPAFDLTLDAPTLNLDYNMNMNSQGALFLTADTLNLKNKITSGGNLIDPSRIFSTATQANVLNNNASIQQAMDITSTTAPVTVSVSAGEYHENLTINKDGLTLQGNAGAAGGGADENAAEIFGTVAGGNIITVAANDVTIEGLHLNAQVGDGSQADSVNGIFADSVDNLAINENTLEGFAGSGISTPNSTNVIQSGNQNVMSPAQQAAADAAAIAAAEADAAAAAAAAVQAATSAADAAAAQAAAQAAAANAAQAAADAAAAAEAEASAANAAAAQAAADAAAAAAAQAAADAAAATAAQSTADAAAATAAQEAADAAAVAAAASATAAAETQAAADAAAASAVQAALDAADAAASAVAAQTSATEAAASATAAQDSADAAAEAASEIDPKTAAWAAVAQARATLAVAKAETLLKQAEVRAEKAERKLAAMAMKQAAKGSAEREAAKAALEAAKAEVQAAKAELQSAREAVRTARAALKAATKYARSFGKPFPG